MFLRDSVGTGPGHQDAALPHPWPCSGRQGEAAGVGFPASLWKAAVEAAGFSPVRFSASAPENPNPRHSPRGNVRMRKFSWSPWQRGLPLNLHNI